MNNGSAAGTTGLYGLTGSVSGNTVQLYATNFTLNDLDPTFLLWNHRFLEQHDAPRNVLVIFTARYRSIRFQLQGSVIRARPFPTATWRSRVRHRVLAFTSSGTGCAPGTYTTPQTLSWTPNSSCTLSVVTPQSGPGAVQYAFANWEDGSTSTTHILTAPTTTATYSANFQIIPTITWPTPAAVTFGSALTSIHSQTRRPASRGRSSTLRPRGQCFRSVTIRRFR